MRCFGTKKRHCSGGEQESIRNTAAVDDVYHQNLIKIKLNYNNEKHRNLNLGLNMQVKSKRLLVLNRKEQLFIGVEVNNRNNYTPYNAIQELFRLCWHSCK